MGNWVTGENSEYILTLDFKIHFHRVDFITHRQIKWDFKQNLCVLVFPILPTSVCRWIFQVISFKGHQVATYTYSLSSALPKVVGGINY